MKKTRVRKKTAQVSKKKLLEHDPRQLQRPAVSGVSGDAAGTQLKDELRAMGKPEREAIRKEAWGRKLKSQSHRVTSWQ